MRYLSVDLPATSARVPFPSPLRLLPCVALRCVALRRTSASSSVWRYCLHVLESSHRPCLRILLQSLVVCLTAFVVFFKNCFSLRRIFFLCLCVFFFSFPGFEISTFLKVKKTRRGGGVFLLVCTFFFSFFLLWWLLFVCVCVCVCFSSFLGFEFSSFLKVKKTRRGRGVCLPAVFSFIVLF
jgi:hypothetical protein